MTTPSILSSGPSRFTVLGVSAGLDLVARLPDDVLAPGLSIVGGFLGSPPVSFLTTWTMFGVVLYLLAPLCYSYLEMLPRRERGFRILFALGAGGCALGLRYFEHAALVIGIVFGVVLLSGGGMLLYFERVHDWNLQDSNGKAVDILQFFTQAEDVAAEIESDLGYEGWLGIAGATFYGLAVMLVLAVPIVLAGLALQVLVYAYPVPDLLFLGWALSVRVVPRLSVGPDRNRVMDLEFDIERIVLDALENATRGVQGLFLTIFCLVGLLLSGGYLFLGVATTPRILPLVAAGYRRLAVSLSPESLLFLWNWISLPVVLVFAGGYGLWAWLRQFWRLPYFLDEWEGRSVTENDCRTARAPGLNAIAIVAWFLAVSFVHVVADSTDLHNAMYAALWPLVVGVGLWIVRWSRRRRPQPVTHAHLWIFGGALTQTLSLWLATEFDIAVASVTTPARIADLLPTAFAICALFGLVFLVPFVHRYDRQHEISFFTVGLCLLLGTLAGASYPFVPPGYRPFSVALLLIGIGLGGLLGLVSYYDL